MKINHCYLGDCRDVMRELIADHHRGNVGLHGMGRKAFERHYGVTELELVEQTRRAINVRCSQYVEKKHGQ